MDLQLEQKTIKAFHWIINILNFHKIEYKISGGFAARIYGVNRELADIDIEVLDVDINKIAENVKQYIIFGPKRYKDDNWDLNLMTLRYDGQDIDIAGIDAKIFNQKTKQWEPRLSRLEDVEHKEVLGIKVSVETKESLIAYKLRLARDVDLEDIKQLSLIR